MVVRNDFLFYLIENVRFNNIVMIDYFSDNYLNALIDNFNNSDYKEIYKYNNNLTLKDVKFSIECFFNHLNFNHYDIIIKNGVVIWKIDNNIIIGLNYPKSNYKDLINKEYLKEWKENNYYCYK